MKIIVTAVVTLVIAIGLFWGYTHFVGGTGAKQKIEPTAVRVEPAVKGNLVEVVNAPGTVQPRKKVSISAKVSARIIELPFKEGDTVTKGNPAATPPVPASVLVRLDSKDLQAALRSVQARYAAQEAEQLVAQARIMGQELTLKATKIALADAQRDLKRQIGLLESHDVSQSIVDTAQAKVDGQLAQMQAAEQSLLADRTNLQVLKHNLEAAEAEIAKSREDLSNTIITSPIDGVVTRLNSEEGEMVVIGITNSPGTTIMDVADLRQILFVAKVDEASIASVKQGLKAVVRIPAYIDETFEGTVESVALSNTDDKDGTKYFKAEILLKTDGRRIPSGLNADADIETRRHEGVVMVPSQAVLGRPVDDLPEPLRTVPEVDKTKSLVTVVYRFVDGKAVVTPVTVGASDATRTVIKSGLAANALVVTGPFKALDGLKHDAPLKDNKSATSAPATQAVAEARK